MRPRNPLSPYPQGFTIMFPVSMVLAVAVPPIGLLLLFLLWLAYLRGKARVNKVKAKMRAEAYERYERTNILAWKSL